jgi:hypothetical protein
MVAEHFQLKCHALYVRQRTDGPIPEGQHGE